jgi:hypothetical protein
VAAPRERTMTMPVHKRGDRWHYAFCIRGVRYRGALPEARTKVQAQKAETKIRQEVYEGRYGNRLVRHLSRSLSRVSITLGPERTSGLSKTIRSTSCR